ncbi:hypothetical protein, partial [Bifidobacterium adolescentis]|uniref:hypothetical protein n=1 Tax=Bifidobacterium adolescentis TaxID=1680 RepID=UPI001E487E8C
QDAGHARFNISTKNKTESAQEFGRYPCPLRVGLGCVVWLGQFKNRDVSRRTFHSTEIFRNSFLQLSRAHACGSQGKATTSGNKP